MLTLALLGPFQGQTDGRPFDQLKSTKAQALLCYLALQPQHVHQREALMTLLWPDIPLKSAQQSLRQTLYRLRQDLESPETSQPSLLADRSTIRWNPEVPLTVDVAQFLKLSGPERTPSEWQEAANLYRGDFLADFYVVDSEEYETWASGHRAAYLRQVQDLLRRLADHYLEQGQYAEAETAVRRNLELDYFQEAAHRQLLAALAATGRREEALSHFSHLRQELDVEFGLEPEPETADLIMAIRDGQTPPAAPQAQRPAAETTVTTGVPPHNLPAPPTPFIGRSQELAALDQLMEREDGRLVTIVGPGGMGKTRLALAWAESQLAGINGQSSPPFQHGIHFIGLAPLPTADLVLPALANALNFPLQKSEDREERPPKQQILDYLCQKEMLLVMDNFEHLLDGAELILDILEASDRVKIMITSRERLNLRQEQVFAIQGLEFPDWETPDDAAEYTAVRLFLQSAHRNRADFALKESDDLTHLARICRLVSGMPLAIELAAAWVELLSLQEISAEIETGLDILETEMRDVPPRQRSVRATMDYSWHKLTAEEKELFTKLAVFRGGFTRDAVQTITGASLRHLARLQNKSLIQVDPASHRYQLHELLRQYAAEKLGQRPNLLEEINGRHADYFARLLADHESLFYSPQEEKALSTLQNDQDNIHAAWHWLVARKQVEPLFNAINSLHYFYDYLSRVQDAHTVLNPLISWCENVTGETEKHLLIRALNWHCHFNIHYLYAYTKQTVEDRLNRAAELLEELSTTDLELTNDLAFNHSLFAFWMTPGIIASPSAIVHMEKAHALYSQSGFQAGVLLTMEWLIGARFYNTDGHGGYEESVAVSHEALNLAGEIGSDRIMSVTIGGIGTISFQSGNISLLERILVESEKLLQKAREGRSNYQTERLLGRYATMVSVTGQMDKALAAHLEFEARHKELGLPLNSIAEFQHGQFLGHVGRFQEARVHFNNSLNKALNGNDHWVLGLTYILMGMNLTATGELEAAEEILRKGLDLQARQGQEMDNAGTLANLGLVLCRRGKYEEARQYLFPSLQIVVRTHAYLPLIELLPGIALLLAHEEPSSKMLSAEIYGLLQNQPYYVNSKLFTEMSGRFLQEVVNALPADQAQSALKAGQEKDIWIGTAELLETLEEKWSE